MPTTPDSNNTQAFDPFADTAKKKLIIVESPNKIKKIREILGSEYQIEASVGHVMDLKTNPRCPLGVDINNGFRPIYGIINGKTNVVDRLISSASEVEEIIIATDPDREGEGIAGHLTDLFAGVQVPIHRASFHEITEDGIKNGLKGVRKLDFQLIDAQKARRVADRIIGYLASPYVSDNLGKGLSAGRVQSIVAKFVVDRETEIENFKPEIYWIIRCKLQKEDSNEIFEVKLDKKFDNQNQAEVEKAKLEQATWNVSKVTRKAENEKPPPPLNANELVLLASRKLKFDAAKAMQLAQNLFESGTITYHRSDSLRIAPEHINKCREFLVKQNWPIPSKPNVYKNKDGAQDAHECIQPTSVSQLPGSLFASSEEEQIYELIWNRFVASQMASAIWDVLAIEVTASSGHIFKLKGETLTSPGWRQLLRDEEKSDAVKLPNLQKNDVLSLISVILDKKQTTPPGRWTEATLIKELEKKGIARPSTIATFVPKVIAKQYAVKKGQTLYPTNLGRQVVALLEKNFDFMTYDYTARLERNLDQIAEGKMNYVEMMKELYASVTKGLEQTVSNIPHSQLCPQCSKPLQLKIKTKNASLNCSNCSISLPAEIEGEENKTVQIKDLELAAENIKCHRCQTRMRLIISKQGVFYGCLKFPSCRGTIEIPSSEACPQCGRNCFLDTDKGRLKRYCSGFPSCNWSGEITEHDSWLQTKLSQFQNNSTTSEQP